MQQVAIYGTAGVGREVHELVEALAAAGGSIACVGFLVDHAYRDTNVVHELPVFGDIEWLAQAPHVSVVVAIGAPASRRRIVCAIEGKFGPKFTTLQHPRALVGRRVTVGLGSIVCAGAGATTDIMLGRHVQLHAGCTIGHDTVLADFVTVAPGANVSGRVLIGEGTFIGAGAVILPDIKIGAWATIGAGAVVTRDIPDAATVAGVPARVVRELTDADRATFADTAAGYVRRAARHAGVDWTGPGGSP